MSQSPYFPPLELVQVVRVTIAEDPSGLLIARSADLPGRTAFASHMASLDLEIRDVIERYFADQDERVRVRRPHGRNRNDLSTWEVETIEGNEQHLAAAE